MFPYGMTDAVGIVRIGAEADDFSSELPVSLQHFRVKGYDAAVVFPVAFRVDFQGLAFMDEIAEHLVEDVAEVFVKKACPAVWGISDDIVEMTHDVEILQPCHLLPDGFEILSVCLFPVLVFVVASVERVDAVKIVDRCYDLVEAVLFECPAYFSVTVFMHSDFDSFQDPEPSASSVLSVKEGLDPVDFLLLQSDVECLGNELFVFRLHRRNEEIAVVCESCASQTCICSCERTSFNRSPLSVKRKFTVIVIVEQNHAIKRKTAAKIAKISYFCILCAPSVRIPGGNQRQDGLLKRISN